MEANQETHKESAHDNASKSWYDRYYKLMLIIPVIVTILCLAYIGLFYTQNGTIMFRDASLTGGTTITLIGDINPATLESELKPQFPDVIIRKLTDIRTGKPVSVVVESSATPENLTSAIEKSLNYKLNEKNSSTEFTGSSLSQSFYEQLIIALIISFILMSFVVFILFRTFVPSMAIIFAAFSDIVIPLAIIDFFGIRISAAGIAAFLMLIGYSVDTDVLLTTRALKRKGGTLNSRIYGAFKTGTLMTTTAIVAVLPSFFLITALPDSFRQIFFILALGLFADIFNTWLTNASIIKWYCTRRKIE
jgi:preprotein translocase subunit SecF